MGTINRVVWEEAQEFVKTERPPKRRLFQPKRQTLEWEQSLAMAAFVEELFDKGIVCYTTKAYTKT